MIDKNQEIHISKFLSLVLRHQPEILGIDLDQNGWTDVNLLITKSNEYGVNFDYKMLKHIVDTNSKSALHLPKVLTKSEQVRDIL